MTLVVSDTLSPMTDIQIASQLRPGVERSVDGTVAVLTMRYLPHNLLDPVLTNLIVEGLGWAAAEGARAVVLRSGLRHFSAGADLESMLPAAEQGGGVIDWPMLEVLRAFDELPIPVVAAVHGVCVGGGLELALASDLVVAAESAKLGSVEATVGLHPLMGGIQRVAQRAGAARAKEMAMLGRRYDARTLERWNVINRVVGDEQLDAAAMTLARELASGPTVAHAATKALVSIAVSEGVGAADAAMAELQKPIFRSEDFRTGVESIRENGPGMARFAGR
jgi:enoyl-CoA hydratase/carnithine racemase